jgi:hypothetical protein
MTPGELNNYARQLYNATNDDFFSDEELYMHQQAAQNVLARECLAIENTYTTSTIALQQEYSFPTAAIAIKRITYNGQKLTKISFREDDFLTGFNQATTSTGTPISYAIFDKVIYLRPVPDAVYTLKLFTFDLPSTVSATSSLDVPEEFHLGLVNFLLWRMALKDQNFQAAEYYKVLWEEERARCLAWSRRRQVADGFNVVRDENVEDLELKRFF